MGRIGRLVGGEAVGVADGAKPLIPHAPEEREVLPTEVPERPEVPPVADAEAVQALHRRVAVPLRPGHRGAVRVGAPLRVHVEQEPGIRVRVVEQQPLHLAAREDVGLWFLSGPTSTRAKGRGESRTREHESVG